MPDSGTDSHREPIHDSITRVGDTGSDVIGGGPEPDDAGDRVRSDPGLQPIEGGDISQTPVAQGDTRGEGTGADTGTGMRVGTNKYPG